MLLTCQQHQTESLCPATHAQPLHIIIYLQGSRPRLLNLIPFGAHLFYLKRTPCVNGMATTARMCTRCAARLKACSLRKPHSQFQLRPVPTRMQHAGLSSELSPVLGIETSCDDTGVAVVDWSGNILGEALHSQLSVHQAYV